MSSPDPFISPKDLTDYLGRDLTDNPAAILVCDAACDAVRTVAEQLFNQATATELLDGNDGDCLVLPQHPVLTAGTVRVNGEDVDDFMVTADGRLLRGAAGSDPRPVWPQGRQNVEVTYDYGYPTADFPRDVRMVALALATRLLVQGPASREQMGEVQVDYSIAATELTANELRILRKYRAPRSW